MTPNPRQTPGRTTKNPPNPHQNHTQPPSNERNGHTWRVLWTAPRGLNTTAEPAFDPLSTRFSTDSNHFPTAFDPFSTHFPTTFQPLSNHFATSLNHFAPAFQPVCDRFATGLRPVCDRFATGLLPVFPLPCGPVGLVRKPHRREFKIMTYITSNRHKSLFSDFRPIMPAGGRRQAVGFPVRGPKGRLQAADGRRQASPDVHRDRRQASGFRPGLVLVLAQPCVASAEQGPRLLPVPAPNPLVKPATTTGNTRGNGRLSPRGRPRKKEQKA
jgi:hypothetical protein